MRGGGEASQNFIYDFLDNKAAKILKKNYQSKYTK
jgi:hypothetical protein